MSRLHVDAVVAVVVVLAAKDKCPVRERARTRARGRERERERARSREDSKHQRVCKTATRSQETEHTTEQSLLWDTKL